MKIGIAVTATGNSVYYHYKCNPPVTAVSPYPLKKKSHPSLYKFRFKSHTVHCFFRSTIILLLLETRFVSRLEKITIVIISRLGGGPASQITTRASTDEGDTSITPSCCCHRKHTRQVFCSSKLLRTIAFDVSSPLLSALFLSLYLLCNVLVTAETVSLPTVKKIPVLACINDYEATPQPSFIIIAVLTTIHMRSY